MRIIAGEARGRRLFAPEGDETRPTADRVREALFNVIRAEVEDAAVLDLFAGSGALALEALSRGAKSAVLCDKSPKAVQVIRRNVELMRAQDRCVIVAGDWRKAVSADGERFTLVFLDPPYRMTAVYAEAARRLHEAGRLAENALIVMERDAASPIEGLEPPFAVEDDRRYRDTALTLVRYRPNDV
ncbi:MAG: 16S rRNA (guanine(966)-N(2))-methyltransferase RsmD [Clostridia bacterium]|nr:16S rRNA (guanine(966)-N(2))-methyltransferase RsmD [Clostridia bacterium]